MAKDNSHMIRYFVTYLYEIFMAVRWITMTMSAFIACECFKPSPHDRHKHKINTKTKHDFSSGTCEDKTTIIFLCFLFCSAVGLWLCLWRSLCRRLDFIPLFCLLFSLMPILICYRVKQALHEQVDGALNIFINYHSSKVNKGKEM